MATSDLERLQSALGSGYTLERELGSGNPRFERLAAGSGPPIA